MGQASVPIVASRKTIERPAGLNCNFVHRQFLIERIFYNDMPVFDFSFPFHSFPVLSVVLSREQAQQMSTHLPLATSAASIGKGYPFRKMRRIFSCWENPKPFCVLSFNIPSERQLLLHFSPHYIQHCTFDFAKATRKIFEKLLFFFLYSIESKRLSVIPVSYTHLTLPTNSLV